MCFSGSRGQLSPKNLCQTQATCDYAAANSRVEGKCTVQFNYFGNNGMWMYLKLRNQLYCLKRVFEFVDCSYSICEISIYKLKNQVQVSFRS